MAVRLYIPILVTLCSLFVANTASADFDDMIIPGYEAWLNSPHAAIETHPFTHWDGTEDKMVPQKCAGCHSTTGHLDYLGADGSEPYVTDAKAPQREGIQCVACHNSEIGNITEITYPSGLSVERFESDARCMDCHQGRTSGNAVKKMIATAGVEDDTSHKDLKFLNIHYSAAAATRFGSEAGGGFEYEGQDYNGFHYHDDYATQCNDCHSPHSTAVKVDLCADCHEDNGAKDQWAFIRADETVGDFDGNGTEDGIKTEIESMRGILYQAIQDYSIEVMNKPVAYIAQPFPYFYTDLNNNGVIDEDEAVKPNVYDSWSPRLARAAYNYQFATKDKGAWAHNGQYVLQLLHDSIEDLGEKVTVPTVERPEVY